MAQTKFWQWLTGRPAKTTLAGTEELIINDGGASKKTTPADIKTYIGDAVPTGEGQNDGLLTHQDKAKLDGIESGATADQTAQDIATLIDADATAEATLKSALGVIGGSTGSTDNAILTADGEGGSTIQASSVTLDGAVMSGARFADYLETGATLPFVADGDGDIEIPLDGKVYALTITDDCDLTHAALPTSPAVGSTLVYIEIDTADDPVISLDAAWHWPDAAVTDIPNGDNEKCELLLNVSPQGWVIARVVSLGVPA